MIFTLSMYHIKFVFLESLVVHQNLKRLLFNLRCTLTKNNNPNSILPLVFEGEAPKAVPRGRGRPRGSKNKPKSSLL